MQKEKKFYNKKKKPNSQFSILIYKAQLTILIKEELNVCIIFSSIFQTLNILNLYSHKLVTFIMI